MATTSILRAAAVASTAGMLLAVVACSSDTGTDGVAESRQVTVTAVPSTTSVQPSASSTTTTESSYTATTVRVTGDNGRVRYDVVVPQIEGGDPAAAAELTSRCGRRCKTRSPAGRGTGSHSNPRTGRPSCTSVPEWSAVSW
ncbi:hypothetical protein [Rhodococcus sp. (in: high G+C Gram-positive bacteria)]|uniref:hypothetical protein n=1 Tax=Rhodococcus sp. TaxID=1831 RepID=UPI003B8A87BF